MKKRTLRCCLLVAALPSLLQAQEAVSDSLHTHLQEVEIISTRATSTTPVAYTNIGREEIAKMNTGVDFPYLVMNDVMKILKDANLSVMNPVYDMDCSFDILCPKSCYESLKNKLLKVESLVLE